MKFNHLFLERLLLPSRLSKKNQSRPWVISSSHNFKSFCEKFNIEIMYCTVGDHRSNGLVEKNVHTVKFLLLAMSYQLSELILNSWIKKLFEAYELPNNLPSEVPRSKKMWIALLVLGGKTLFLSIVSYIKGNWSSQTMGRGAGSSLMGHRLDMKTWTWVFLSTGSESPSG